jgi:hypothetical protein
MSVFGIKLSEQRWCSTARLSDERLNVLPGGD